MCRMFWNKLNNFDRYLEELKIRIIANIDNANKSWIIRTRIVNK